MTLAPWHALLAIAAGSIAGALLRQATTLIVPHATSSTSLRFTISGLAGVFLGAVLGWIATMESAGSIWRSIEIIAMVATLGAFAAAAVGGLPLASLEASRRPRDAAVHIGITLLSAALGVVLASWWQTQRL